MSPAQPPPVPTCLKGAGGLVSLCAWRAPQAPTRPLHSREGDWSRRPASCLPAKAKPPHYPLPQAPAANMAPLDYTLLTVSGVFESVMRPLSTSESITRLGCLRNLWALYRAANSSVSMSAQSSS